VGFSHTSEKSFQPRSLRKFSHLWRAKATTHRPRNKYQRAMVPGRSLPRSTLEGVEASSKAPKPEAPRTAPQIVHQHKRAPNTNPRNIARARSFLARLSADSNACSIRSGKNRLASLGKRLKVLVPRTLVKIRKVRPGALFSGL